jgi:hypothetical protein
MRPTSGPSPLRRLSRQRVFQLLLVNLAGGSIRLPGAPVSIAAPYTYADFRGTNLEVHAGVQVAGRSGVLHEPDVGVLHNGACTRARAGSRLCSHHAELAIEVKCYDGTLGPAIGRSVLGLNSDTYCTVRLVTNTRDVKARRMLLKRTKAGRLLSPSPAGISGSRGSCRFPNRRLALSGAQSD